LIERIDNKRTIDGSEFSASTCVYLDYCGKNTC